MEEQREVYKKVVLSASNEAKYEPYREVGQEALQKK